MTERIRFSFVTACCLMSACGVTGPEPEKQGKTLRVETEHLKERLIGNARTVGLEAELDGKEGGKGILTLDPNVWRNGATTLLFLEDLIVTLKQVKSEERAKLGQKLYEITGKELDSHLKKFNTNPERLFVAVPEIADAPCWFLVSDMNGKEVAYMMRSK